MKTTNDIIEELTKFEKDNNKLPTKRDFPNYQREIRRKYKTWNNFLIEVFGKVNKTFGREKQEIVDKLLLFYKENKRLPKAEDDWELTYQAQYLFGTWNTALESVFGKVNQRTYDKDIIEEVKKYIIKYKRLPLREEFDGINFPHFLSITRRLGVSKWSDIYKHIDLSDINYYNDSKHGTGKVYIDENGIVYLSRQEFLIGEWLTNNSIKFEKEVPYGNSNYIFDFYLPEKDIYIEYYGLSHREEYKKRIEEKRKKYNGRKVIEIMKHDNTVKKLSHEVQRL